MAKPVRIAKTYINSRGETLLLHDTFVYDVEIYKSVPNSFNLEDSRTMSFKEALKLSTEVFWKNKTRFTKRSKLIAAPLKWLLEQQFTETISKQDG